jgi:hypothetical protein
MTRLILAAAVLVLTSGCAGAQGEKLTISKAVWADYQNYRSAMTSTGVGVYAVTPDGQGGAGASCAEARCTGIQEARAKALGKCEELNPGDKCLVFAEGRDPVVEYQVGQ